MCCGSFLGTCIISLEIGQFSWRYDGFSGSSKVSIMLKSFHGA